MTSMVAALALMLSSSNVAQAQDFEGTYDLQCDVNEIQIRVKMEHTGMPGGVLYVDAFLLPLDCSGVLTQQQLDDLQAEVFRSCSTTNPAGGICEPLTADLVAIVGGLDVIDPIDQLTISDQVTGDAGFSRALLGLDFQGKAEETRFRVRIQDDGDFASARRVRRDPNVAGLQLDCASRFVAAAYGHIDPAGDAARVDYRRQLSYSCLGNTQTPVYERAVFFDIDQVSRAETPSN